MFWIVLTLLFQLITTQSGFAAAPIRPTVVVNVTQKIQNVRPYVFGNNVQWVDSADGLYDPATRTFNQPMIDKLKKLKITMLRFPGGSFSDAYHWKDGVGDPAKRKKGKHVFLGSMQDSIFGTDEFLELCKLMGAEPFITVNVLSGTPQEAAEWVKYTAGRVKYWEIGNEPYLEPTDKKAIDQAYPDKFAADFTAFAKAMKAADPNIQVGIPLRNNLAGRYPAGPYKEWNNRMKGAIAFADFVTLHNAYFPMIFKREDYKSPDSFLSLLAAGDMVRDDTAETKRFLRTNFPGRNFPLAITEYNSYFAAVSIPESDKTASLAAGVYVASLLIDFFKDDSILMAHYWSLTGNWFFGTLGHKRMPRPQYYMLQAFSEFVGDTVVQASVKNSPVFNSPAMGYMPDRRNVEALQTLATVKGNELYVIILNRSLSPVRFDLKVDGFERWLNLKGARVTGTSIAADNENQENVSMKPINYAEFEDFTDLNIPSNSLLALRIRK